MTKRKTMLTFALAFCLIVPAMLMLSACGAKSVVGSWETYQMIVPAEKEGGQDTIVNLGEEFEGVVLSKDTFNLTIKDDMSLKFIQTIGSMSMKTNSTYTNNDGVYIAELVIQLGGGEEQHGYLQFTYDKDNDRISCALQERDVETGEYITGFTVIFTRVNEK